MNNKIIRTLRDLGFVYVSSYAQLEAVIVRARILDKIVTKISD